MSYAKFGAILGAVAFFAPVQAVRGGAIDAVLSDLGGGAFRYDYTMINDGSLPGGADIESFDIEFLESAITGYSDLAAWDEFTFPGLGDDLLVMDAIFGPGLPAGDSLNFYVEFEWAGIGLPSAQNYVIYDPVSFAVLETGTTNVDAQVPVPATLWLTLVGIALLGVRRRS
jgi:hypothetical protein